jgi:hypothetical protein
MKKQIPPIIINSMQEVATKYSESAHTTNAGLILRTVAKIIPLSTIIKLFAHALKKPH